ncbi:hypothetical protein GQR58_023353 [Nymphon striatum]|nr:hypothetical protein GQR58_023353 [Nymphon striatum]
MLGISWKEKKTNEWIRNEVKRICGSELESVMDTMKRRKSKYFGHMVRGGGMARAILEGGVEGSIGHGTCHVMSGIACVTPTGEETAQPTIPHSTQRAERSIVPNLKGQFGHVPIKIICSLQPRKEEGSVLFDGDANWNCLDVFSRTGSTHPDIARAGEVFLLQLYGSRRAKSLDKYRYMMYFRSANRTSIPSSGFKLESLVNWSFRACHAIQQWHGNVMTPTEWGWQYKDGLLVPIETVRPVAPQKVLKMIACACKVGCRKSCGCYKAGLECTVMCTVCVDHNCTKARAIDENDASGDI